MKPINTDNNYIYKHFIRGFTVASVSIFLTTFLAASADAATFDVVEEELPKSYTDLQLLKRNSHLFAFGTTHENEFDVLFHYRDHRQWTDVLSRAPFNELDDIEVASVGPARKHGSWVMAAIGNHIWKVQSNGNKKPWMWSGELPGDIQAMRHFSHVRVDAEYADQLFVLTSTDDGIELWSTDEIANEWMQWGEAGLGLEVTDTVVGFDHLRVGEDRYLYFATADAIYRASIEDASTWEVVYEVDSETTITAMQSSRGTLYVGVVHNSDVEVWSSDDGATTLTEDTNLDVSADATSVTSLFTKKHNKRLFAVVNTDAGVDVYRYMNDSQGWSERFTFEDGENVTSMVKEKGKWHFVVEKEDDHAYTYRAS